MNDTREATKQALVVEVAKHAQDYGTKLHAESVSFVVGREVAPGETAFIVQEANTARLLAVHQAFAALTVRWRHHLLVAGVPESIVKANELQGVKVGMDDNQQQDALNRPLIVKPS